MGRPHQETVPIFPATYDSEDDYEATGCTCFRRFCFGLDEEETHSYLLREKEGGGPHKEAWLVAKLKKMRELSELVAGPKWKNLIRKIGKIWSLRKHDKTAVQLQYSPESYALNFAGDDDDLLHSFSAKFAPGFFINDQQRRPEM